MVYDLNLFGKINFAILFGQNGDDLNLKVNRRLPQIYGKHKTTSICWQMEDDLNFLANGRLH